MLRRELGVGGAVVTGLGSIMGTGAFVAIAVASGMWGEAALWAIPLAAVVAVFNGLSSAFLAGRFPVAGGTYEYAYRTLGPWVGFAAGWLFLLAKTASAATAALGVALYLGLGSSRLVAVLAVVLVTALVLAGLRRTTMVNLILVSLTVAALVTFGLVGISGDPAGTLPRGTVPFGDVVAAVAFLFVAYTGYGRIATLGEEVRHPERAIPRAVVVTLAVAAAVYLLVGMGGRAIGGPLWGQGLEAGETPASLVSAPWAWLVQLGGVTAMAGVLLNLVLGLSRVWLAMGRRGDMPSALARLDRRQVPMTAVVTAGVPILGIALIGDVSVAWSFSAFTVLLYYGITNLAATRLQPRRATAWAGLASSLFLSFFVPLTVWVGGAGLVLLGLLWKWQRPGGGTAPASLARSRRR